MSIVKKRVEYDLGRNRHGQPVTFVVDGESFVLIRGAANQLDNTARGELSAQQLISLREIIGEILP